MLTARKNPTNNVTAPEPERMGDSFTTDFLFDFSNAPHCTPVLPPVCCLNRVPSEPPPTVSISTRTARNCPGFELTLAVPLGGLQRFQRRSLRHGELDRARSAEPSDAANDESAFGARMWRQVY